MGKRDAREGSQVCLKERTAVRPLLLFLVDPQQISRAEVESSQSPSVQNAEAQAPATPFGCPQKFKCAGSGFDDMAIVPISP